MATEEQKNNQQTLNDLLKDYISGQLEAAEYTALVTSRTADLTDAIRRTVKQKREATELDKQLVSSVKKIADLTRSLEKPYQSVSDVQKDIIKNDKEIIKLENSLGALRSKLSEIEIQDIENYKTAQQSVIDNEKLLGQLKSQLNAEELKAANEYFDFINANQEAINKENKLKEQVDLSSFENKKTLIEELKAAELKANEEVFISKQEVNKAEEVARKAQLDFQAALAGTNEDAKRLAKEKLDIANSELNIAKEFNREYETIQFNKRIELSTAEKTLTNKEKELLAAQKLTEITAKELEDYEKVLEVRQDINIEAVKAASTTEKSLALSRDELEISQKQLTTDAQIAAQAEESLEVARTNAKFLADQEAKQKELLKIQGLYNISLGFVEGFLKKMGANSAVIALGLEEGKKAAEEMALAIQKGEVSFRGPFKGLQKQLAVFSAGVKGTFKGMGEGLKQALGLAGLGILIGKALGNVASIIKKAILFPIKTAFSALLAPAKTIVSEIGGYFNEAFSYIRDNFFSIRGLVSTFKEGETLMKTLSLATEKVATDLGVSTASARQLNNQVARLSGEMGALPEKLAENMVALNQSFGTTQRFSNETVRSFNKLVERLGFSTEEAAELVKISKLQGETTNQTLQSYEDEVLALKNQYGIAISSKEIFQEISKVSSATRLTLIGQNKSIGAAVFQAKRLGLELSKIEDISSSLLDFESSISKELEAELLIGRDLNLERARQAALQGDFAAVAKEISKEAGSAAEFGKLNIIQQEGLAAAVGMTRNELAKVVETQALLEATGFEDMNSAQAEFNKLVASGMKIEEAQAKFRQKYGNEALDTQLAQVAYAKQRELQERKLAETQMAMAQAMLPVAQAFIKLQLTLQKIRNIIVQEMRPFFNAFSGLIGDASKSMETGLYKYASLLGEKLNAVGLTLVQFFKTQGPNIKETFMSILDVFGSIYDLVGNIIKELFNIKGTSSVADPLKNALQLVQNIAKDIVAYVKTIDAGSIAEKIKSVITGIGNFYQGLYNFVKGTITTIRDVVNYVKENPIKTLLGAGAVTGLALLLKRGSSRLLPMFVKNVDGPGGGGMFETLKNLISKPKSGTGLTGANRIVNAIKGGFKGGGFRGALKGAQTASSRMLSSSLGNIGSRFLGRTGAQAAASTVAQAGQAAATAGRVASTTAQAGRAATAAAGIGRAAVGGGIAIVGIAAEMALDHFASKARESAASIDEQIAASNNEADIKKLNAEKESKLNAARNLEIGASTAKWAGIGASVGMLFGPLGAGIGAGVGAVAGFTAGIIEANKQRAFELTETGKFQKELRETQLKAQKSREQLDLTFAKLELRKRSDQLKASLDIQQEFATKLKGIDLSVPMEKPTEAFKALAQTLLDTGQITEEQFKAAISGTISPLQLMKNATNNATDKLAKLYGVVAAAVKEEEERAKGAAYAAAGTSEDLVKVQQELVGSVTDIVQSQSSDLFNKYGEKLTEGFNSTLKDFLANNVDEKAFRGELVYQFTSAGIASKDIAAALGRLDDKLKAGAIEDIALGTGKGIEDLVSLIGEELKAGVNLIQAKAEASGSGAAVKAGAQGMQATELAQKIQVQIINEDNSSKFRGALGAARSLTGISEQVTKAEEDKKITTEELDNIITTLSGLATTNPEALKALQQLARVFPKTQDGVIPSIQRVQDGSSISNNGPFTIQDSKGNLAITHPKDKLVVSPNVSYINDGATSKGGPVFPISEKFGALDVKVSPKGVMVQKVKDALITKETSSITQKVKDALVTKETLVTVQKVKDAAVSDKISDKEIDKTKQEIWDKYKGENRQVIPLQSGIYVWDSKNSMMFTIDRLDKSPSDLNRTIHADFINTLRLTASPTTERDLIGIRSDMGFANPSEISSNILARLVYEALGTSGSSPHVKKGNESTLDSILDPFQPDLIKELIKGYTPLPPTKTTYFHSMGNKKGYRPPDLVSMSQSASEGLSLEGAAVQQVQDAISPWEIFSDPLGAVKHYLLPVIVEESGHIIKSLFKSKALSAPLKAILKKTPIIGHAMHAATGAINISHLLHKEGVTKDKLDQEVGKAALTTVGGIGGGILGTMIFNILGNLATSGGMALSGPAGMVLSVLGGTVGGMLGEMFAGFVADKLGAKPVGSPIVSLFRQEYDQLHPPTLASPNLVHTAPKPKTSPQRVSDGSSSSKGPFTIMDRLGNIAVTHPKDGIVVSPNISYVNDGVTSKRGPVFPISEKFGALDVKVSPKGVSVQKVNDALLANDKTETIKEDIWNKYGNENRNVIPYHSGIYVWDDAGSQMFFIPESAKQPSHINKALRVPFLHALRATSPELIGMRSDMGFVDPTKIHTPTVLNLVDEALGTSEGNPASGTNGKGNESTLGSILDPFQPELIRKIIKNYAPVSFDRNTTFHTLDKKEGYKPGIINVGQSVSEGLSLENVPQIQKVQDGATLYYKEVSGSTDETRIISPKVLQNLGISGVTEKNYKDQFIAKGIQRSDGKVYFASALSDMSKSQTLSHFTHAGPAIAEDSFIIKYINGETDQILDKGTISFPRSPYKLDDIQEISASGNGLLALSRALTKIPEVITDASGEKKIIQRGANKYNIGFQQDRESSSLTLDSGKINDLTSTFNGLKDLFPYLAVTKESANHVTGIPITLHNLKAGGNDYDSQIQYARTDYVPNFLNGTVRNFIPSDMGVGEQALVKAGLEPYDFSIIGQAVEKIKPKVSRYKDTWSTLRNEISYAENTWKTVRDLFIPQYVNRVLGFAQKYVSPEFYEKFEANIKPQTDSDYKSSFAKLFTEVKTGPASLPPAASLKTKETQYALGSAQETLDGISSSEIRIAQRVNDGSVSSKGPFTIMDRLGNIAVTHPKDGLVVSPNISYVNDGATGKGGPVFPISEKFGALDVKVSPKGVMVQKINDGVVAPSTYQEVLGSTSATNIISSNVISGLGVPGVTEENFKGQFTVATPSGLKNIVSSLNKMGKSKTLSEFIPSGPAIADNSFIVKYSDNKVDQILNEGNIKFPQDPYTKLNLTEISASGNGLLALSRALNEIEPREVKNKDGVTITSYLADRYGIGFKQDRKSSGLILDPGPINNLVATFNSLQELFPYLAVTKESDKYVTGIPATKINLGGKRNDYDSQIQHARTDYVPQLLNNTIKNFIPADRGIGEEALIKEGLEPFDFSKIKEVIENIKPKVSHYKDTWSALRNEISYSEKAWEIVRDSFIPQYINRVLGFAQKYVSPQFYEQFKTVISPKTEKSFTFKDLFDNTELGQPGTTPGAAVKTAQGEYAEGSIQKTSDGISTVQHLQETNQIQQVNDGFIGGIMEQTALLYDPIGYIKEKLTPVIAEELVPLIQHLFKKGSILNKAFKNLAKKIPYIGPLMDIGGGVLDINKVLSSGQSRNQINTDIGNIAFGALGSIGGAALGGIAGSALGPIGTFVGSFAGAELGGFVSEYLSKYLGGPNLGNLIVNNIPQLAEGGVVSKPTVALIGEAGPEAVVPLDQIAQESTQTSTTVIESDNSDLKKELELMRQLMSELIKELPSIANRPIRVELDGNRIGGILGNNAYRG